MLADVDGTLVTPEKTLTDRSIAAVRELREAGIGFAITSGRPPRGMAMLVDPLGLDLPMAAFNGGLFVNPDMSVIEEHAIPAPVVAPTVALMSRHGLECGYTGAPTGWSAMWTHRTWTERRPRSASRRSTLIALTGSNGASSRSSE